MNPDDFTPSERRILAAPARLFNAISMGDPELVGQVLGFGGDPNAADRRGNTALFRAVRGRIVESSVVQVLLAAGADPSIRDSEGFTALDRARRRLSKYEGKPRVPPRRSPSLTPHGDVRLAAFENEALERVHREHPDFADEFEAAYLDSRRRAAERVFDTRGNLERIVALLEGRGL